MDAVTDEDFDLDRMFPTPPLVPVDRYTAPLGGRRRSRAKGRSKAGERGCKAKDVDIAERGNRPVAPSRRPKLKSTWD